MTGLVDARGRPIAEPLQCSCTITKFERQENPRCAVHVQRQRPASALAVAPVLELPSKRGDELDAVAIAMGMAQDALALFPDPKLAVTTLALAGAVLARLTGLDVEHFCQTIRECDRSMVAEGVDQELGRCRVCGCTDDDCSGCIERTGERCAWVEVNLCSACVDVEHELVERELTGSPRPANGEAGGAAAPTGECGAEARSPSG